MPSFSSSRFAPALLGLPGARLSTLALVPFRLGYCPSLWERWQPLRLLPVQSAFSLLLEHVLSTPQLKRQVFPRHVIDELLIGDGLLSVQSLRWAMPQFIPFDDDLNAELRRVSHSPFIFVLIRLSAYLPILILSIDELRLSA